MVIMFVTGTISFCLVGSMWIISSLLHRPIIGNENIKSGKDLMIRKNYSMSNKQPSQLQPGLFCIPHLSGNKSLLIERP